MAVCFEVAPVFFKVFHALAFHKKAVASFPDAFSCVFGWHYQGFNGFNAHEASVVGGVAFFFPI